MTCGTRERKSHTEWAPADRGKSSARAYWRLGLVRWINHEHSFTTRPTARRRIEAYDSNSAMGLPSPATLKGLPVGE